MKKYAPRAELHSGARLPRRRKDRKRTDRPDRASGDKPVAEPAATVRSTLRHQPDAREEQDPREKTFDPIEARDRAAQKRNADPGIRSRERPNRSGDTDVFETIAKALSPRQNP